MSDWRTQGPSTILPKIEEITARAAIRGNVNTREELLIVTGGVFGLTLYLLLFGPPLSGPPSLLGPISVNLLWFVYFVYAISGVMLFHFSIFTWEAALAERGRHLSKRLPKYLEYAYTVIVAASLVQIFVFAPRIADYVTWLQGDEDYVGNQIKRVAQSYLKNECTNREFGTHFTDEYCKNLKEHHKCTK